MTIKVSSAHPLQPAQQKSLADKLTQIFGPDCTIVYHLDPTLIGGLRLDTPKGVLDQSIAARLNNFKRQLSS